MATVYKLEVEIVSDFCAYNKSYILEKVTEALTKKDFVHDEKNGLNLRVKVEEK